MLHFSLSSKYVDSHLRPYRCRFMDRSECEDLRFSSNACLLRHEREAHGEHAHGVNPFLCKFPDCERARDGNGFPRRWNQRDHMKRVHQYEDIDSPKKGNPGYARRRKTCQHPASTAMKRSGSSAASKAQVIINASISASHYGPISRAQYATDYKTIMPQAVSMSEVLPPVAISRISRVTPP